jgi:chorismate mutase
VTLDKIRRDIDAIDAEILSLLGRRFQLALRTRAFKALERDPSREREIFSRLRAVAAKCPLLREEFIFSLYREILKESCRLQARSERGKNQEQRT